MEKSIKKIKEGKTIKSLFIYSEEDPVTANLETLRRNAKLGNIEIIYYNYSRLDKLRNILDLLR
ncbi:hypothetical protein B6F84_12835 [Acidianus manzaensis]|uniref:Uncharacterized protein n=1 Tax=Acidianus manzaensis TaxID=282676 RepID=A0A1W6K2R5_9CREN|nr:hypothetical protein B6F84_12835 [Acidianus manzaensis]